MLSNFICRSYAEEKPDKAGQKKGRPKVHNFKFSCKIPTDFFSVTNVGNISPRVGPLLGTRKCGTGIFSLAVTKAANM